MMKADVIETLERIENLPTLPAVARQILALLADTRSNMSQVAAVIARDQAVAARVIRVVNSAFYGLRTHVSSIQHAIVILGLNTVKNLVLGVSVIKAFESTAKPGIFDREQFWIHTFAVAAGARLMAEELKLSEPEDYFLAGLLHDIGILAADQFLHEDFVRVLETSLVNGNDFLTAERAVLGAGHGDIGAFLAVKWGVPPFLAGVMRFHHSPESLPAEAMASRMKIDVVHVADAQSRAMGIGKFAEKIPASFSAGALKRVSVAQKRLEEIFGHVKADVGGLVKEWGV